MNKFKKGDWVRDKKRNKKVYEVISTSKGSGMRYLQLRGENGLLYTTDHSGYRDYDMSSEFYKKWKPKTGEWCWFWDDGGLPVIEKLHHINKTKLGNVYVGHTLTTYRNTEPFFGSLPTPTKNIQFIGV